MKKITKMLLINWFNFSIEVIDFNDINFLTGENGTGKSTIIDALQLLFLVDTSGTYFNKAANDKSDRTLQGYLRCEFGYDDENGLKYKRNTRFTSYIVCEFFDDERNDYFTAGFCYDFFSPQDDERKFFYYDGKMHDDYFIIDNKPMDIYALSKFIAKEYPNTKGYLTDTNRNFRERFYGKLGALPYKFSSVFKKAVPFTPIINIKKFIEEFICDDTTPVDTTLMQDVINDYKELEKKTDYLIEQVNDLELIHNVFEDYNRYVMQEVLYKYLIERSYLENEREKLLSDESSKEDNTKKVEENELTKKSVISDIDHENNKRDTIINSLYNNDNFKTIKNLESEIDNHNKQIYSLNEKFKNNKKIIIDSYIQWEQCSNKFLNVNHNEKCFELSSKISEIKNQVNNIVLNCSAENINSFGENTLKEAENTKEKCKLKAIELRSKFNDTKKENGRILAEKNNELKLLETGINSYPKKVELFKKILSSELKSEFRFDVEVKILAQLLEIKNERWRNAIEGYLNTQKYYIIVEPNYFESASRVYNKLKNTYNIYGVGLVDTMKIAKMNINVMNNSLAQEIVIENKTARTYIDYLLGKVIKCDDIESITQHPTSITDECMLYKGYVLKHLNPETWKNPAIGRTAIELKIKNIKIEILELEKQCEEIIDLSVSLDGLCEYRALSDSDIVRIVATANEYLKIPEYQSKIKELQEKIDSIDTSPLTALEDEKKSIETKLKKLEETKDNLIKVIERHNNKVESLKNEITNKKNIIKTAEDKIKKEYSLDWINEIGENRFILEYDKKNSYETISKNYKSQLKSYETQKNKHWNKLIEIKSTYINKYKEGYSTTDIDNKIYDDKLAKLKEVKLPEYLDKIKNAKEKSYEQFQEDFLSKMKTNIINAENQIDDINKAIKSNFNGDKYKFTAKPNNEYRRFYDMFTSNILEQGFTLFSAQFNEEYKEEISELFELIVNDTTDESYKKKIELYTDYRTYLDFDLEVVDENGNKQSLSKTLKKKSGGETQTPFYIAVLASFAQIYRIGRGKSSDTIRLIIFDEAFSKMDGERIRRSIELLRHYNFQVILSAPSDKIQDISTLVDRNLIVLKDDNISTVKTFDPREYKKENNNV